MPFLLQSLAALYAELGTCLEAFTSRTLYLHGDWRTSMLRRFQLAIRPSGAGPRGFGGGVSGPQLGMSMRGNSSSHVPGEKPDYVNVKMRV
mmetsp:Transcript_6703/g.13603  ORF Transcript_6703/g.13603 Transcript_6703/m.13603 type:complete len:91 (-) Transcript_6703:8-280(-)